ncbi:hypothetical protein LIER_05204 [Lithospermum erythrorhizon]|uniref:Uncharacterized protein n=1 Tax=Lithospermum erythrorhizon TaxID=34254 RepID=A0AAV3P3Q4_LITER
MLVKGCVAPWVSIGGSSLIRIKIENLAKRQHRYRYATVVSRAWVESCRVEAVVGLTGVLLSDLERRNRDLLVGSVEEAGAAGGPLHRRRRGSSDRWRSSRGVVLDLLFDLEKKG